MEYFFSFFISGFKFNYNLDPEKNKIEYVKAILQTEKKIVKIKRIE